MTLGTATVASETTSLDEDRRGGKSDSAYRTISEVAIDLNLPQHVLRFWESKFKQISPLKRGGGRRYYRPQDVDLIKRIHHLLHTQGYTIKGVQKLLIKDRNLTGSMNGATEQTSAPQELTPVAKDIVSRIASNTQLPLLNAASNTSSVTNTTDLKLILNRLKTLHEQISQRC
jgi:DNA-binding transcriptional MerR regulator